VVGKKFEAYFRNACVVLMLWLTAGPLLFFVMGEVIEVGPRTPAMVLDYAKSNPALRAVFLFSGLLAVLGAWLSHRRRYRLAFAAAVVFPVAYVLPFVEMFRRVTPTTYASFLPILLLAFLAYQGRQTEASAGDQVESVVRDD